VSLTDIIIFIIIILPLGSMVLVIKQPVTNNRIQYDFHIQTFTSFKVLLFQCSKVEISHLVCSAHPYLTSLPGGTGKNVWEYIDMLWCQGAQNIGLSNHIHHKLHRIISLTFSKCLQ